MKNNKTQNQKPVCVIRVQSVKATIWREESESGVYYSTSISRTYRRDDGSYGDSSRFSHMELLAAACVAQKASDYIGAFAE